jgi:nicotinamidase-related amidase
MERAMNRSHENVCARSAVLIVDVQTWIFHRQDPVYQEDRLIANINTLEAYAQHQMMPVVYIQHESSGHLKKHSPGWQLHAGLHPHTGDLFLGKRQGNAFVETPLHDLLQERHITRVLICGLLTQQCIVKTVLGAVELGYETVLVSDAHSNSGMYPEKNIKTVHKRVEKAGAHLMTTGEIVS